jgi:hypothetical protein
MRAMYLYMLKTKIFLNNLGVIKPGHLELNDFTFCQVERIRNQIGF